MSDYKFSYFYIVVSVQSAKTGKMFAEVDRVSDCDDICRRYAPTETRRYVFGSICPTKKKAEEIAEQWNDGYRKSGRYPEEREDF